jgi:predicted DNA-binding protein
MTKLLSVRVKPELFSAIDARSDELGRNRSQYILGLIQRDLDEAHGRRRHRFASDDLIGSIRTGIPSGDNATVREVIRKRFHEKNR